MIVPIRRFGAGLALVACVALGATAATARPQTPPSVTRAAYTAAVAAGVAKGTEIVPGLGQVTGALRNLVLLGVGFELATQGALNLTKLGPPSDGRLQMSLANFNPAAARAKLLLFRLSHRIPARVKLIHFSFTLTANAVKTAVKFCAPGSYATTAFFDLRSPHVALPIWRPAPPNGWEIGVKNLDPNNPVRKLTFWLNCVSGLKVMYLAGDPVETPGSVGGKPSRGTATGKPCPTGYTLGGGGFKTAAGVEVTSFLRDRRPKPKAELLVYVTPRVVSEISSVCVGD